MSGTLSYRTLPITEVNAPNHQPEAPNELFNTNQHAIFGEAAGSINVGINTEATIAVLNPRFQGLDFGVFRVPTFKEVIQGAASVTDVLSVWSRLSFCSEDSKSVYVPPETGRAILLPESTHGVYRDLLIKGTGLVDQFTKENKLRDGVRGFNGVLELSEAERDLVHTDILERAGVLVASGVGIVDHHRVQQCPQFTAWIGNYIRAFRVQTRISNLFELSPALRQAAIDDAIKRMDVLFNKSKPLNYADYFMTVLKIAARNVAIMQAIGFTQDSFHFGQVTLCGELVDFGAGNFNKPRVRGGVNSMYPWFRFDRQPILMQNMMYKTHAVKAEPDPVLLDRQSSSVVNQRTLFGAIRSFSPEAAQAIEAMEPTKHFWETYEQTYASFDSQKFEREVLNHRVTDYFSFEVEKAMAQYPNNLKELIYNHYQREYMNLFSHFENQVETWDRRGPSSIHRMLLFFKAVQATVKDPQFQMPFDFTSIWPELNPHQYFKNASDFNNPVEDISWKPNSKNS